MNTHRTTLISSAASDAHLPAAFAAELIAEAPWLDGTQELNEQLAEELLAAEIKRFNLSSMQLAEFIERYNALVQGTENPLAELQSEAYVAFGQALAPYGRADAFGEGDYWLVSDSFRGGSTNLHTAISGNSAFRKRA